MDDVSLLENAFLALKIFKDGLKMVGLSKYVKTGGVPSNPIGGVFQNKNVPGQNDHFCLLCVIPNSTNGLWTM